MNIDKGKVRDLLANADKYHGAFYNDNPLQRSKPLFPSASHWSHSDIAAAGQTGGDKCHTHVRQKTGATADGFV